MATSKWGHSLSAFALLLAGCGAGASDSTAGDGQRPDIIAEEGRISERLGEATCGSTTPDAVLMSIGESQSADGKYDHATCRNSYIVEFDALAAGSTLVTAGIVPASLGNDPFGCLFNYAYMSLWQKQGATYVNVNQTFGLGLETQLPTPIPAQVPTICTVVARLTVPTTGDYRVVASSGAFFGTNTPVRVAKW